MVGNTTKYLVVLPNLYLSTYLAASHLLLGTYKLVQVHSYF